MGCRCLSSHKDEEGDEQDDFTQNPLTGAQSMQQDFNNVSSLVHKLIDVGLLAANFAQLRVLLSSEKGQFYHVVMVLVVLSIVFQVVFLFCIVCVWYVEYKLQQCLNEDQAGNDKSQTSGNQATAQSEQQRRRQQTIKRWKKWLMRFNITGYVLVSLVVFLNVGVCGLGIDGRAEESSKNIGKSRYVGVINGSLHVFD